MTIAPRRRLARLRAGAASSPASPGGVGAALGWAAAGVAVQASPTPAVPVGVSAAVFLQSLGWRRLIGLLVGATFVTRLRFDVAGSGFRLEHFVLFCCVVALLFAGRQAALLEAARDRTSVLVGAFVAWNAAVSILNSPQPGESLLIVGWLALDWLMLAVLVSSTHDPRALARQGVMWAGAASVTAVTLWVVATATGRVTFGVQRETLTGSLAAYGLSHEANILASTLAVWVFVALTASGWLSTRARFLVAALGMAGMAVSLTRAASVGLLAGLAVWGVVSGRTGRRVAVRTTAAAAAAVVAVVLVAPGVAAPLRTKAGELVNFDTGTGKGRLDSWGSAVGDLDGAVWLVGLGTNSYGQRHLDPTRPDEPIPGYLGNLPLQVLYDSGLVGVVLLGGALVTVVPRQRARAARALGLVTLYVVCAVATSPVWFGTTWVILAITVVDRRRGEQRSP